VQRTLGWVDRQGQETAIPAPPRAYNYPRIAPDGTRIALWSNDQESDIWLWDLARATLTRVTLDPGFDFYPVWTPDGRRLIFSSEPAGARNLFWQAADGTAAHNAEVAIRGARGTPGQTNLRAARTNALPTSAPAPRDTVPCFMTTRVRRRRVGN